MVGVERGRGWRGKEKGGSLPFGFFFSPLHLSLLGSPRRRRYSVHVLPFACTRARLANTKFSLIHRASNSFHIRTVNRWKFLETFSAFVGKMPFAADNWARFCSPSTIFTGDCRFLTSTMEKWKSTNERAYKMRNIVKRWHLIQEIVWPLNLYTFVELGDIFKPTWVTCLYLIS